MQHSRVFERQELDRCFASYVGMEGGNPRAPVWICDRSPAWSDPLTSTPEPRVVPPAWDAVFRREHREDMSRWLAHQCVARIMAAARAEALRVGLADNDWKRYFWRHLYAPEGAEFRLSLFPLPTQVGGRAAWSRAYRGQPELYPQSRYLDLCRYGERFRLLATMRALWRPKLVVCLNDRHTDDYLEAFSLGKLAGEEHALQPADQVRRLRIYTRDGTTWIICPAIGGAAGLNSQVLLDAFGRYLGTRLAASDFNYCFELDGSDNGPRALPEFSPEPHQRFNLPRAPDDCSTVEGARPVLPENVEGRADTCESIVYC